MLSGYEEEFSGRARERLWGILDPLEHFITVDHRAIWRRHLAWAKKDGAELRSLISQRYSANMVFMSLMLSAELMILFNSSRITTDMRGAMSEFRYYDVKFYIGLIILLSAFFTVFTLVSTFTAWGIVSSISDSNAHCFLRSSVGQYAAQLPSRLLVSSIYLFLLWLSLWAVELLPLFISVGLLLVMTVLFHHIVTVYSAFGRLIILTGGMGSKHVLEETLEKALLPSGLTSSLLHCATGCSDKQRLSATVQYRGESRYVGGAYTAKNAFRTREVDNKRVKVSFAQGKDGLPGHRKLDSAVTNDSILTVESEIIRQNAHAMFGPPQVPAFGAAGHVSVPVRNPTKESVMPSSPVSIPSDDMNQSSRRSSLDLDDTPDGDHNAVGVDRSVSWDSGDSTKSGEEKSQKYRLRVNARARAMSNTAEWTHESMARMMYDAPPAAGLDYTEENPNKEGGRRLSNIQRASVYNRSVLKASKKQNLWGRADTSREQTGDDNAKYSFFRGPTLPLKKMLSRVLEGTLESEDHDGSFDNTECSGLFGTASELEASAGSIHLSPEEKRLLQRTGDYHNYDLVEQEEEVESLEIHRDDASREKQEDDRDDVC